MMNVYFQAISKSPGGITYFREWGLLLEKPFKLLCIFLFLCKVGFAQTNPTAQALPYSQNFGTTTFTSMPAGMAAWNTFGSNLTTQAAAEASVPGANATIAAQTASTTTGGVFGYAVTSNARAYIQQSGNATNGTNQIVAAINTGAGVTSVSVSYQLELINGGAATQDYGHALQYRAGTTGAWTTVTGSAMTFGAVTTYTASTLSYVISGLTASTDYQIRWIVWRPTGSGASKGIGIDNISIANAVPSIALSAAHPSAASINQGTTDNIIGGVAMAVTTTNATLNSASFTTAGTYISSDVTNFKVWLAPNATNLTGATQIGGNQASVSNGGTVAVSGLSNVITSGTTRYLLVTADISGSGTLGNTLRIASTAFANIVFATGNKTGTNPVAAGANDQTIASTPPAVALANGTIAAANINQGTINNVLYRVDATVSNAPVTLTSVALTTAGTYAASDLVNLKVWYSTSATFSTGTATQIGTKTTGLGAGTQTFSSLSQNIPVGTAYIYLTADLTCAATTSNIINVAAITTGSVTITSVTPTGSGFTAGGAQTIIAGVVTPLNPTAYSVVGNGTSGQVTASWTTPTGCYDEIMIVAATATIGTVPTGDGTAYTANSTFGSGTAFGTGFVLFKGTSAPQTFTGFTNGTNYFFKVFTRYNSTWSAGTEVTGTSYILTSLTEVVVPQFMQGLNGTNNNRIPVAYCLTLTGLTPNATYNYINQVVNAADGPTTSGAGNCVFPGTTQSGSFTFTSGPSLSTGPFGTFTANSSGNYTGWFVTEPTANARFVPGTQVNFRIRLNNGAGGTSVDRIATTSSGVTILDLAAAASATNGTAIRSTSLSNAKDFVCLYDNTTGSGRPLAATYIENEGNAAVGSYASFYSTSVNSVAGAWGTIIPNVNANGVRRIETRSFTTGSIICSVTDADGTWPTGSINTSNPTGGTTELVISSTDAGLNCTNIILDHSGIAQTTNTNMGIGTSDNILSNFRLNNSIYSTTLNSITFTPAGTFAAGDVTNFKLYTSATPSFPGGAALRTVAAGAIGSGTPVAFTALAQSISTGDRYFWIVADFSAAGSGNTIQVPALGNGSFAFNSNATIGTNSISAGGTMTLALFTPDIAVSSLSIGAGSLTDGSINNVLYRVNLAVTTVSASLTDVSFTTTGSYSASDVSNFKLWASTNATFATGTSTLLGTKSTALGAGLQTFSGLTQVVPLGTSYIYITSDVPCATTIGNDISINAVTTSDLTFASANLTGGGSATGAQTFASSTPLNVTTLVPTSTGIGAQISVAYTLPASCYDEIMIIASPAANTGGSPTGNGSAYTAVSNYLGAGTVFGNGKVVYKGSASSQLITGLSNGLTYFFKVFTRNGTNWSTGTEQSAVVTAVPQLTEVILPQFIQGVNGTNSNRLPYAYRATLYNLTANATYRYYNQVVNGADAASSNGAGNVVFAISGGFVQTSSPALTTPGTNCNTFTADASGSYTGWFITEPSGNARFTPGTTVNMRIMLNDGAGGTTVVTRLSTTSGVTVVNLGTTASDATGVRGSSSATPRNFVFTYGNTSGSGRPVAGTYVESDGTGTTSYASFYAASVQGANGAYGTFVPNNSSTGIRRIEQRSLSTGSIVDCPAIDADGTWPSGAVTSSANTGTTEIVITSSDAPLGKPFLGGISQAPVCEGSNGVISMTGVLPSSTFTVDYTVNGVAQTSVTGVTSNASGQASFVSIPLTLSNNGQAIAVTGLTRTDVSPNCSNVFGFGNSTVIVVNPNPTLGGISQTGVSCDGQNTTISLTGLVNNSTASVTYTIDGGAPVTVTNVVAVGTTATMSVPVVLANDGQSLVVTNITITSLSPNCSLAPVSNNTLNLYVNPRPSVKIDANDFVCLNQTLNLNFDVTNASSWSLGYSTGISTLSEAAATALVNGSLTNQGNFSNPYSTTYSPTSKEWKKYRITSLTNTVTGCTAPVSGLDSLTVEAPDPCFVTWNGSVSSDWNTGANWTPNNGAPSNKTSVVIPGGTTFQPNLNNGSPVCASLTLTNGAVPQIASGFQLNIRGDLTGNSYPYFAGNGKVVLSGTGLQTISGTVRLTNVDFVNSSASGVVISSGATLQIEPKGVVTFGGNSRLVNNGNFVLRSDATGTASIGAIPTTAIISPAGAQFTQERYLPYTSGVGSWYFLGSPMAGKNFTDWVDNFKVVGLSSGFGSQGGNIISSIEPERSTIFKYVESTHNTRVDTVQKIGWTIPGAGDQILPGTGYRTFVSFGSNASHKFDSKGTLTRNDVTFPALTRTELGACVPASFPCNEVSNRGWNLLANPYPSDINWDAVGGWTKPGQMSDAWYRWNSIGNGYGVYGTGLYAGATPAPSNPNIIPSGQGFFVKLSQAGTYTSNLVVKESAKITSAAGQFLRTNVSQQMIRIHMGKANAAASDYGYDAVVRFSENATDGIDQNMDFTNLAGSGFQISVPVEGQDMSISTFSPVVDTKIIPLATRYQNASGEFKLKFSEMDELISSYQVFLRDNYLGTIVSLNEFDQYTYNVTDELTASSGRFELLIGTSVTGGSGIKASAPTIVLYPNPVTKSSFHLASSGLSGKVTIEVMDILGRKLILREIENPASVQDIEIESPLTAGKYLVKITDANGVNIKSLMVK